MPDSPEQYKNEELRDLELQSVPMNQEKKINTSKLISVEPYVTEPVELNPQFDGYIQEEVDGEMN